MRKTKNNYVPAEYGGYMFPKSCLPDILPGDAGKVLTVNQNETEAIWARGNLLVHVNLVYDDDSDSFIAGSLDKTWEEIYEAYHAGIPVSFLYLELTPPEIVQDVYYIAPFLMDGMGYDITDKYFISLTNDDLALSTLFKTDTRNGYPRFIVVPS